MDLYATKRQAFTKILMPLMMPGIISGYLLAFIVSLDDFIINFVKGAGIGRCCTNTGSSGNRVLHL